MSRTTKNKVSQHTATDIANTIFDLSESLKATQMQAKAAAHSVEVTKAKLADWERIARMVGMRFDDGWETWTYADEIEGAA